MCTENTNELAEELHAASRFDFVKTGTCLPCASRSDLYKA